MGFKIMCIDERERGGEREKESLKACINTYFRRHALLLNKKFRGIHIHFLSHTPNLQHSIDFVR